MFQMMVWIVNCRTTYTKFIFAVPELDFSLVIGTGKYEYGLPLGKVNAVFADFRFNQTHLGIRRVFFIFAITLIYLFHFG